MGGRWPKKVAFALLALIRNLEINAKFKGLKTHRMWITHVGINRARQGKRRTYRAHGRINPLNSHPCHIEMFVEERAEKVPKSKAKAQFRKNQKITSKLDKKSRRDDRNSKKAFRIFD